MNKNFQRRQQQNRQQQNNQQWDHERKKKKREKELKSRSKPMSSSLSSSKLGATTAQVYKVKNRKHLYSRRQWKIRSSIFSSTVRPEKSYYLRSQVLKEDLVYTTDSARNSVELVWEVKLTNQPNVSFEPKSGLQKPVKYNQKIAIGIDGPGGKVYLYCRQKLNGERGLSLSKEPKYEWRIKGNKAGKSVKCAKRVSLFNIVAQDYLVFKENVDDAGLAWYLGS